MGKKSKRGGKEKKNLPGWHDKLPVATPENVAALPQVDHGWLCAVFGEKQGTPVLAIMDITNQVRGEGSTGRVMNLGPCPDPADEPDRISDALLATMMGPSQPTERDLPEYYRPRRPAWVLLQKELEAALGTVSDALGAVGIAVKLNTPEALAEGGEDAAEDSTGRTATWEIGLAVGATVENVSELPMEKDEVWKASMSMVEDADAGRKECFLAVENVTAESSKEHYPLGFGPCPAATVNPDGMVRCLFAAMLSPRGPGKSAKDDEKEAGDGEPAGDKGKNKGGENEGHSKARRPGRVIIDKFLEPWLEHLQSNFSSVGIAVELA
eukprot:CAMPEP_0113582582 /NCGR_PEP_ID=MMETSP0015_2-20120614/31997_1 /TAXON_ID=2838 /ORGANISM="Odontella" /LENGTH=324 /DNA_ID=CAMNT_0000487275 /DNA_START=138 /DNA_END=1112 /DNA_ORIENTATION=+ /assembly_acc=CAM_ASM_000160